MALPPPLPKPIDDVVDDRLLANGGDLFDERRRENSSIEFFFLFGYLPLIFVERVHTNWFNVIFN